MWKREKGRDRQEINLEMCELCPQRRQARGWESSGRGNDLHTTACVASWLDG